MREEGRGGMGGGSFSYTQFQCSIYSTYLCVLTGHSPSCQPEPPPHVSFDDLDAHTAPLSAAPMPVTM